MSREVTELNTTLMTEQGAVWNGQKDDLWDVKGLISWHIDWRFLTTSSSSSVSCRFPLSPSLHKWKVIITTITMLCKISCCTVKAVTLQLRQIQFLKFFRWEVAVSRERKGGMRKMKRTQTHTHTAAAPLVMCFVLSPPARQAATQTHNPAHSNTCFTVCTDKLPVTREHVKPRSQLSLSMSLMGNKLTTKACFSIINSFYQ